MKNALTLTIAVLALVASTSASASEQAASQIQALSCAAANGVTFKSTGVSGERAALQVSTQWGVFHRTFTATVQLPKEDQTHTVIELADQDGTLTYLIDLASEKEMAPLVDPGATRFGTLEQAPLYAGALAMPIASVQCELTIGASN